MHNSSDGGNLRPGLLLFGSQEARHRGFANRAGTLYHPAAIGGFLNHTTLDLDFLAAFDAITFKIHCFLLINRHFCLQSSSINGGCHPISFPFSPSKYLNYRIILHKKRRFVNGRFPILWQNRGLLPLKPSLLGECGGLQPGQDHAPPARPVSCGTPLRF